MTAVSTMPSSGTVTDETIIGAAILQTAAWLYSVGVVFPTAFNEMRYMVKKAR